MWIGWRRNVGWLGRDVDLNGGGMLIGWAGCGFGWRRNVDLNGGGIFIGWGGMWIWLEAEC